MSLYYFYATIQVLSGNQDKFNRTPKGGGNMREATPKINKTLIILEILTFIYSALALAFAIQTSNYWTIPFSLMACIGFLIVFYFSWIERKRHAN
jgi:cellulose synthase (UDP-forming)